MDERSFVSPVESPPEVPAQPKSEQPAGDPLGRPGEEQTGSGRGPTDGNGEGGSDLLVRERDPKEVEAEGGSPASTAVLDVPEMPGKALRAGSLTRGRLADLRSGTTFLHTLKIVYWGPGRSGKTTNVKWLHGRLQPELRGRLVTLDGPGERTLYFDCLPLDLNPNGGPPIQLRLYTVPGQPRFRLTRRLVLQGVDGLVFVWDARSRRLNANLASLLEARETLAELGVDWASLPRLFQYNKLDLSEAIPPEHLDHVLDRMGERGPRQNAVATVGTGVLETLGGIARAALRVRRERERAAALSNSDPVW